jgi:hypothetical protein
MGIQAALKGTQISKLEANAGLLLKLIVTLPDYAYRPTIQ